MEEGSQIIPLGFLAAIMKKRQKVISGKDTPGYLQGWEKSLCGKESIESTSSIILPTIQEGLATVHLSSVQATLILFSIFC